MKLLTLANLASNADKLYRTINNRKEKILLKFFLKTSELRQTGNDWIKINPKKFEDNELKILKRKVDSGQWKGKWTVADYGNLY